MLSDGILAGDLRAASRLMRLADDRDPRAGRELAALHPHTGRAHIVGITGNPGAGKSTLVDRMISAWRGQGKRVGVVAIDPSSPFSGGAILGDRIRMQRHTLDEGVFIRSLATRGHLGGLSRSTGDVIAVLDAMGFDVILVETVGVGQDEVDIVKSAHTCVVVLVPGLGDGMQILKAGLIEIADIFAVNKADRPETDRLVGELEAVQSFAAESQRPRVPVIRTIASEDQGTVDLLAAIDAHRQSLKRSGELRERELSRLLELVRSLVRTDIEARFEEHFRVVDRGENLSDQLVKRSISPHEVAARILSELIR